MVPPETSVVCGADNEKWSPWGIRAQNLNNEFCQISYHFIKSYSCYTCLIEMLYPSVGVLSFTLEMSECSIDWVIESQLKYSQS